jgi:hypothetical protein
MIVLALSHKNVTITFDNLTYPASKRGVLPESYKGLKWAGFEYMNDSYARAKHANSGYATAFMSIDNLNIAFSFSRASISIESPNETFSVLSVTACAAWNDDLQLAIAGHRNSTEIKTHTSALLFGKPQEIVLGWTDIDTLIFNSSGGTAHSGNTISGNQFILTCLRFVY